MGFKQFCSPVATISGPRKCVVYRDIRLLKAHSQAPSAIVEVLQVKLQF